MPGLQSLTDSITIILAVDIEDSFLSIQRAIVYLLSSTGAEDKPELVNLEHLLSQSIVHLTTQADREEVRSNCPSSGVTAN